MPPLLEQEAERIKEYPFEEDKSATCVTRSFAPSFFFFSFLCSFHTRPRFSPRFVAARRRSRLGCQVRLTKEMDGMVVYVPDGPDSDIP